MNIKEELACNHCKQTLSDPVSLNCCGSNVCKKHIDESVIGSTNKFCWLCGKSLPNHQFQVNKPLKSLIEMGLTINDFEKVLNDLGEKIKMIENMRPKENLDGNQNVLNKMRNKLVEYDKSLKALDCSSPVDQRAEMTSHENKSAKFEPVKKEIQDIKEEIKVRKYKFDFI